MEFRCRKTYFLTLTFDDEHLPVGSPSYQLKYVTDSLQKFMKRLRSKIEYHDFGLNFKYFAVSENGEENGRLHLHVMLFAKGTNTAVLNARTAVPLFRLIDETWKQGRTQIRVANEKHVYYLTKYIFKRCFDLLYHSWKSNGIGLSYMDNKLVEYLRSHVQDFIHLGGKVRYLPRYIRDKCFGGEYEDFKTYLTEKYLKERNNLDDSYSLGYYMLDMQREYSPIPNWLGDRILRLQRDSKELYNIIKYGGSL